LLFGISVDEPGLPALTWLLDALPSAGLSSDPWQDRANPESFRIGSAQLALRERHPEWHTT
jgi:hypothetical protein